MKKEISDSEGVVKGRVGHKGEFNWREGIKRERRGKFERERKGET